MFETFAYDRRVAFADTDAMGVTHHANYLRYCEEARVAWMRTRGLSGTHYPLADRVLALLHYQMWHMRPSRFDDALTIRLQVRQEKMKIRFQYQIWAQDERIAEAETLHIAVTGALKPVRPDPRLMTVLEREKWTETWLSNS